MPDDPEIQIKIGARDEASGVFDRVRRGLEKLRGNGQITGVADTLKETLGEDRVFKSLLKGGEAGLVGEIAANATGKFADVNEQLAAGKLDASGLVIELGKGIPILSGFVEAGQNIRELLTGEKADIARITEETRLQNEMLDYRQAFLDKEKASWRSIADTIAQIREESAGAGLEGFPAAAHAQRASADALRRQTKSQMQAELDEVDKGLRDRLSKLSDESRNNVGLGESWVTRLAEKAGIVEKSAAPSAEAMSAQEASEKKFAASQRSEIEKKYAPLLQEQAAGSAATQKAIEAKSFLDSEKLLNQNYAARDDLLSAEKQTQLRFIGQEEDAEIESTRRTLEAKKKQIDETLAEQKRLVNPKAFPDLEKSAKQEKDALDYAAAAEIVAAAERKTNAAVDRGVDVERMRSQARIDDLRIRAELGGQVAQMQEEQAEIAEKYAEKRQDITKKLREEKNLTSQQREQLQGILGGLDEQEAKEKKIAAAKRLDLRLSSANTDRNVSGVLASEFAIHAADMKSKIAGDMTLAPAATGRSPQGDVAGQFRADWLSSQKNAVQWAAAESVYGKGPVSGGGGADSQGSVTEKNSGQQLTLSGEILAALKQLVTIAQSPGQAQSIFSP